MVSSDEINIQKFVERVEEILSPKVQEEFHDVCISGASYVASEYLWNIQKEIEEAARETDCLDILEILGEQGGLTFQDLLDHFSEVDLENVNTYKTLFEMANFQPEDSGLPYAIWFDDSGKFRNNTHFIPHVKIIMDSGYMIPVSIEEEPKILLKAVQLAKVAKEFKGKKRKGMLEFISLNHLIILQHWNGEITTKTLFNNLQCE